MNNNNNPFLPNVQVESEEDAKKKQAQELADKMAQAEQDLQTDLQRGAALGEDVIGDGLGRLSEDANLQSSRDLLAQQAEGITSAQNLAQRESALSNLQGSEQSQNRSLLANLAGSGVQGGSAAAQLIDLNSSNLNNRRSLERDLISDQTTFAQNAANNLANVDKSIAEFDLGQLAAEKNIDIQSRLGFADLGSAERAGIRSEQAIQLAADTEANGGKK